MVTAGPGSGKTHVLVNKVEELVNSGVDQSSILCMTFTEKATNEMKTRLENHDITEAKIATFHSFSFDTIQDNFLEAGIRQRPRMFLRPFQLIWCIRNTDNFELNHEYIKNTHDMTAVYTAMLEAMSRLKQEGVNHEELQRYIDSEMKMQKSMIDDDDDIESDKMSALHRLNELNKVYKAYEEFKRSKNFMDFEDMVYEAIKLFKENKEILRKYQKKYKYLLIDEFQDNNYSQLEIVKLLGSHRNVTVVGDRDQSIMRFQGSYKRVFDDFKETYPEFQEINLAQNYRSTKNIIKIADQILDEKSVPGHTNNEDGNKIDVVSTDTDVGQVEYIANQIQKFVGSKVVRRKNAEPVVTYKDITILARRNSECSKIVQELDAFGIPAVFVGSIDIQSNQIILDIIAYLRIIHYPNTSGMEIFRILKNHDISEENIEIINNFARRIKSNDSKNKRNDHVMDALKRCSESNITQKSIIEEIVILLDRITDESQDESIGDIVLNIAGRNSGIYKKLLAKDDRKNILIVNAFCKAAKEYQDDFPDHTIREFLEYVPILNQYGMEIEEEKEEEKEDAINVMTMHRSKGKEFPIVFIPDMVDRKIPTQYRKRDFEIPDDLRHDKITVDLKIEHEAEERRLFYVACTRAMNRLLLVHPKKYLKNVGVKKPSKFLEQLEYSNNSLIEINDFTGEKENVPEKKTPNIKLIDELQMLATDAIYNKMPNTAIQRIINIAYLEHLKKNGSINDFDLNKIIECSLDEMKLPIDDKQKDTFNHNKLTLSASSINSYEKCPLQFKFNKILHIPQRGNIALDLGTVIHKIVDEFGKNKINGQESKFDDGMNMFKNEWKFKPYRDIIKEDITTSRTENILKKYLEWDSESKNTLQKTEDEFSIYIEGIKFNGKIDRLEINQDGEYEIVDFKTGKNKPTKKELKTSPQLNIYAEAVRQKYKKLPAKASLFYPELDKTLEYSVTNESLDEAMESIKKTIKEILGNNFKPTPGNACRQCGYADICEYKA